VTDLKFSVVIPYKQRLHNLTAVLASLAGQTLPGSEFEVLVGAMEYSPEYVRMCREFTGRLDIVSVLTSREWNVCRARNLAMRQATGQVTVLLDADIALPPDCLRGLFGRYFAAGQDVCVLGKLAGYSEVDGGNVEPGQFETLPYSHYRAILAGLAAGERELTDPRWDLDQVPLPWTLVWTALVALPTSTIRRHGLGFDERFCGWGPEDQEWGYRVHAAGTPIVRGDGVYGLHLPHVRDAAANWRTDRANSRYFLAKWPCLEVELSRAFGWRLANQGYLAIGRELASAGDGRPLGVARGTVAGTDVLLVGVPLDGQGRICPAGPGPLFDGGQPVQALPLAGFAVPYPDKSVTECRVLPPIARLSARYRDAVLTEAERVAHRVVLPAQQPGPASRA
jgi:glycosyltransferase involved in cell wall biosynthesis